MKVLFFIETGGPGGAEQVVLQLARGAQERGHTVEVATLRCGWLTDRLAESKIIHHHLESASRYDLALPLRLARLLKGFDVLHTHLFDSAFYGALAARWARCPHIATEHGDIHHITKRSFSFVKVMLLKCFHTRFSAVSHFTKQALIQKGIVAERIKVIGNPVRPEQCVRTSLSREELGLGGLQDAFLWIHVANHRKVKDQRTLLTGFAEALQNSEHPQCLLLVGDGPERSDLEGLVAQLGIKDAVRFLGFRDDVQELLSVADAMILSSLSEALPMSLLEAGALGLALVSSDVGGVRDIIEEEKTGLLFPRGDRSALAEQLVRLVHDQSLCRQLQENIRNKVATEYSLTVVLDAYESLYCPAAQEE